MAPDETLLEELYELLTLYFEISPHVGFVKTCPTRLDVEPQLDRVIFREELLARITALIVGGDEYVTKKSL